MIERKDIDTLAELSRLELSEDEKNSLQKDLEGILAYVGELKKAGNPSSEALAKEESDTALVRNVMRADEVAHEPGAFTDDLLAAAPRSKDGYVVVKKIL